MNDTATRIATTAIDADPTVPVIRLTRDFAATAAPTSANIGCTTRISISASSQIHA